MALGGLPLIGTLYYNSLITALSAILCVVVINRVLDEDSDVYALMMWTVIALIGLVKIHLGIVCGISGILVEGALLRLNQERITFTNVIVYRFAPIFGALAAIVYTTRGNIGEMMTQIRMPTPELHFTYGIQSTGFLIVQIICLGSLALLVATQFVKSNKKEGFNKKLWWVLGSWATILVPMIVTTPDQMSPYLVAVGSILLLLYVYSTRVSNEVYKNLILALCVIVFGIEVNMVILGERKSWDEHKQQFIRGLDMGSIKHRGGFFDGITVRPGQEAAINIIEAISKAFPDKKIFFGPEAEMFYVATKRLPPERWILWSHPGVSFIPDQHNSMLSATLNNMDYDIVICVPQRHYLYPYMDLKALQFKFLTGTKDNWVWCATKDESTAKTIQEIYNAFEKKSESQLVPL